MPRRRRRHRRPAAAAPPRPAAAPRPGRTEIITNDQNPNFTAQFSLTYLFEEVQRVRLEVYDVDTAYKSSDASNLDLGKQDFQGKIKIKKMHQYLVVE